MNIIVIKDATQQRCNKEFEECDKKIEQETNSILNVRKISCKMNKSCNVDYYFGYRYYSCLIISVRVL